jgi:hypothetical protein
VINGEAKNNYSGRSISSAGDVNGDGLDDLIVGVYLANPNGMSSGKSYVVFGKGRPYQTQHTIYLTLMYHLVWQMEHPQSNHPSHRR